MSRPLSVAVVCGHGVLGGAERWLLQVLAATDRIAAEAVVLEDGPLRPALLGAGLPTSLIPTGRRAFDLARSSLQLARLLRVNGSELVLANGVKAALVAAPAARAAGARCVWVKHDHTLDGPVMALLARLTDGCVAVSPELAAASRQAALVVPPPRPVPPLPAAQARARLGVRGGGLLLAAVGRLVRYKGFEDAVLALREPVAAPWRLVIVGDGPDRARLRALAERHGVADRVHFAGEVPDAGRLLSGVDAAAVLTKPAGDGPGVEGFGTVALEAMAAGVPVVVAGGPAARRIDGPAGPAGLVVPPGAPREVATALGALADPATRSGFGAAGLALVAGHPTARRCAGLLAAYLARVACRPGAGRTGTAPVSVVTTVLDDADGVHRLLGLLGTQLDLPGDEVVVVDGGSRDATAGRVLAWSAREPRIRLVRAPGAGISAGRNTGVRAAANDLIACTDAGCDPAPGWLAALRSAFADAGPGDLLTGVYRVTGDGILDRAMAAVGYPHPAELRRPSVLVRGYGRLLGRTFDPTMPTGRSMAFGVAAWKAAGGFPEDLATGEDVTFGRAVSAAGGTASMVADAEVAWAQRADLLATARMYFRYGQGSGRSRDRRLLARDLARLLAYLSAPALLARGGWAGRVAALGGTGVYLSLPLARALRDPAPGRAQVIAALPVAVAVRDLAKAAGAVRGLLRGPAGDDA